jgi:hypothetical protein
VGCPRAHLRLVSLSLGPFCAIVPLLSHRAFCVRLSAGLRRKALGKTSKVCSHLIFTAPSRSIRTTRQASIFANADANRDNAMIPGITQSGDLWRRSHSKTTADLSEGGHDVPYQRSHRSVPCGPEKQLAPPARSGHSHSVWGLPPRVSA